MLLEMRGCNGCCHANQGMKSTRLTNLLAISVISFGSTFKSSYSIGWGPTSECSSKAGELSTKTPFLMGFQAAAGWAQSCDIRTKVLDCQFFHNSGWLLQQSAIACTKMQYTAEPAAIPQSLLPPTRISAQFAKGWLKFQHYLSLVRDPHSCCQCIEKWGQSNYQYNLLKCEGRDFILECHHWLEGSHKI